MKNSGVNKIMIVAGFGPSLLHFRGDLIKTWLNMKCQVVAVAPEPEVKEELEAFGIMYRSVPLKRTGLNPLHDIVLLIHLIRLIKQENPGYLFLYTIKPVIYGSIAALFFKQIRVFSMITGLGHVFIETENTALKRLLLRQLVINLYKAALKKNEKVFFQNPDDLRDFEKYNIVERYKAVIVNGSGINLDYYQQAIQTESQPIFLLIARLLKEKGISEYVEAARIVKMRYPEAVFRLVGGFSGINSTAISREQIELWRKESNVEFYGKIKDVRPFIKEASVYVLPSYREGTPRSVLEAMAMGRAVITTDAPGCRETVIEGVNGFLVPVKDINALAEAMERFIKEPELIIKMGAASRKIAEDKYDVHKVNRAINEAMGFS